MELIILRNADHPNICKLYEAYCDDERVHFVLEYCPGGNLGQYVYEELVLEFKLAKIS